MARIQPEPRSEFRHFLPITTRSMDNDVYGRVNNVVYYSYFDPVVNEYLISEGVLDKDRATRRPATLPAPLVDALEKLR